MFFSFYQETQKLVDFRLMRQNRH